VHVTDQLPDRSALEAAIGVELTDRHLLQRALTHRSYAYEKGGLPTNERLEFLGDAVLGLVVTDHLYLTHSELPEGQLAKLRAAVVNMNALADIARGIGLGEWLLVGRGEETTGGRDKASILADSLEALLGAIYLDQGLETVSELIHRLFDDVMETSASAGASLDWKTSLQELTAAQLLGVPEYTVTESGPDHAKHFEATAVIADTPWGTGTGRSKKEAEQKAAEAAWTALQRRAMAGAAGVLGVDGALTDGSALMTGFDGGVDSAEDIAH